MPTLADLFRGHYRAGGVDFDSIRVHRTDTPGSGTARACRAVGARAFTVGTDIYFAAGQFRPGTRDGLVPTREWRRAQGKGGADR